MTTIVFYDAMRGVLHETDLTDEGGGFRSSGVFSSALEAMREQSTHATSSKAATFP